MSDGKTHGRITEITSQVLLVGSLVYTRDINTSLALYSGCLTGLILEPDLDLPIVTESEGRLMRFFYPIGFAWYWLWKPYSILMSHRSPFSHWPFLGTLIRYCYLGLFITVIGLPVTTNPLWLVEFVQLHWVLAYWFILGNCIADIMHFVADQL